MLINTQEHLHIDAASTEGYPYLIEALDVQVGLFTDANTAYRRLGRSGLIDLLQEFSPPLQQSLAEARFRLDKSEGFVTLANTDIDTMRPELAQLAAITLSTSFGIPTQTDRRLSQIAWPIKYDPGTCERKTFSQTMGEASYHTDTQYYEQPEKYFGLYCVQSDELGKGTNKLISARTIVDDILGHEGAETIYHLSQPYPFRVPTVFTETACDDATEVTWAPILDYQNATIRYRKDTLLEALALPGVDISDVQHQAIEAIEAALVRADPIEHHLYPGDAIIVNNHRMLHARTPFANPERLLYRVRMTS